MLRLKPSPHGDTPFVSTEPRPNRIRPPSADSLPGSQLNPVERVWLYLRERHLSHRLLDGYDAVVDALCRAWNALTVERIRSLTSYPYLEQVKV